MATSDQPNDSFLSSATQAAENKSVDQQDPFWSTAKIDAARWNQLFPYQLLVVQKKNGAYSEVPGWVFTLPFPPSSVSRSTPFAIEGSVTQGGYVEQHGGTPIRQIQLSGTLGVLPLRPLAVASSSGSVGPAIFDGTIQLAGRVAASAPGIAGPAAGPPLIDQLVFDAPNASDVDQIAKTSGYYQLLLLEKFFEDYAAVKQTLGGRDYLLAFAHWKHQAVYLVMPQSFVASQSAESPLEHTYSLSLRAWRRVQLDVAGVAANQYVPVTQRPGGLQSLLDSLVAVRDVLENARDVLSAVGGDLDAGLFQPLRQVAMFARDALSVPLSFSDLPLQVLADCQDAVVQYVSTTGSFQNAGSTFDFRAKKVADAAQALAALGAATSKVDTLSGNLVLVTPAPGQPPTYLGAAQADAALDVFRHPGDHYDFLSQLKPSQLSLPPHAVAAIQAARLAARALTRLDFEGFRDSVRGVLDDFTDAVGAGDPTYNSVYQRAARSASKVPTKSDWDVIFALNRAVTELSRLAASGTVHPRLSSLDYVAGLARRSGIAFRTPRSKYAVPFPYGVTLEQFAARYLGDPDRWVEVAALNGLRAPYVDEVGFDLALLTDGSGNQLVLGDVTNLYVGQQVWVSAAGTARAARRVTKIEVLSPSTAVVTVDGDPDLDRFGTLAGASVHAFLPDTVNSQMTVYLPSDNAPADIDLQLRAIPGLDVYDQLLAVGGVDLLLTSDGDLVLTPDGDTRWAVGMTNIVQTARIALSVVQGTLLHHPEFGLPIEVGQSVADLDARGLLKASQGLFAGDPTFTGVQSASVRVVGGGASVSLGVGIRGQPRALPITFNL